MYSKISIDFNFKVFLDAEYTEYETISMQVWNDSNKNSYLPQLKSPLPDTYCWENTKMKQILWTLDEIDTDSLSKKLNMEISSITSILQPPGSVIPPHVDSFFQLRKKYPYRPNPVRAVIFIEDWKLGHFLQCNDDVYTHWKCGDGLIMDRSQCHLSANAGVEDKHTVQVSGFMND
jgi:hypothetical protein